MTIDTIRDFIVDKNIEKLRADYGSVKMYAQCVWKLPPAIAAMLDKQFCDEPEPEPISRRLEDVLIRRRREHSR